MYTLSCEHIKSRISCSKRIERKLKLLIALEVLKFFDIKNGKFCSIKTCAAFASIALRIYQLWYVSLQGSVKEAVKSSSQWTQRESKEQRDVAFSVHSMEIT